MPKFVYKRTKKSNIYCLPCPKEAKQKLNRNNKDVQIVYAKMCTAQVVSGHIYYFLSGLPQFLNILLNRVSQNVFKKIFYVKNL